MNARLTHTPGRVDIRESEYMRLLGFPSGRQPDTKVRSLMDGAQSWYHARGMPWVAGCSFPKIEVQDAVVEIMDDCRLESKELADRLYKAGAHEIHVVAVSAGRGISNETARMWEDDRVDESWFLDAYGSAVVEQLISDAGQKLCEKLEPQGMAVLPHHSPGYTGWDIAGQPNLVKLFLEHHEGPLPGPLEVLWSGMLVPKKSMLAVFGVTRHIDRVENLPELIPCYRCDLDVCRYRRAPHQLAEPANSGTADLNGPGQASRGSVATIGHDDEPAMKYAYAFKPHILKKWSDRFLDLEYGRNKQTRAVFRMNGNTCSNMGVRIVLDFDLTLTWQDGDYLIESGRVRPVEGETGYQEMCEFIQHPDEFREQASSYVPLQGQSLDRVLEWSPDINPAGCLCERSHQDHKWRMVYQTIHFALKGNK